MSHTSFSIRFILVSIFSIFTAYGDTITIHNMSDQDLFVATYYWDGKTAERASQPIFAAEHSTVLIERPHWSFWKTRELAYAYDAKTLSKQFDNRGWNNVMSRNISGLNGSEFTIFQREGIFHVYNNAQLFLEKPFWECVNELSCIVAHVFTGGGVDYPAVEHNPYASSQAVVRKGNDLHPAERAFLKKREPIVRRAMENVLQVSLKDAYIPKIAIVGSGGGFRAMLCTTGSLLGAERINLLDATTYITALSGSTWAVGSWYATGLPIKQFSRLLIEKTNRKIDQIDFDELQLLGEALKVKMAFNQPLSIVDLYGLMLGTILLDDFGDERHQVYLSHQAERISQGTWPYPIYTSVRAEEDAESEWYEFTPHEVGGSWLKRYVPTWAFGRKFANGYSIDYAPEQSLSFLFGIWGSAFGANVQQIYESISGNTQFSATHEMIEAILMREIGQDRLTYGEVNNFTAGMRKPVTQLEILEMVDAGASPGFNLPYPPISGERPERKADIIIFLDSSADNADGMVLRQVEAYAHAHDLPFARINYDNIENRAISIFKDENDPDVPVVIYMPSINDLLFDAALSKPQYAQYASYIADLDMAGCIDSGYCSTFNFDYTFEQAMSLIKLTEFNMLMCQDAIWQAVQWVIEHK